MKKRTGLFLYLQMQAFTEKKIGITCIETESSKRVTNHSRVINALHYAIITDFLVGIVVQSLYDRIIVVQS